MFIELSMCAVIAESQKPILLSFQQGVDGYAGAVDTEIWALATTTILDSNPNASSDANNDGGESQVLLRFEGIIGTEPKADPAAGIDPVCQAAGQRIRPGRHGEPAPHARAVRSRGDVEQPHLRRLRRRTGGFAPQGQLHVRQDRGQLVGNRV